eukprot:1722399-Pyramimonas_sp.AAC.1
MANVFRNERVIGSLMRARARAHPTLLICWRILTNPQQHKDYELYQLLKRDALRASNKTVYSSSYSPTLTIYTHSTHTLSQSTPHPPVYKA